MSAFSRVLVASCSALAVSASVGALGCGGGQARAASEVKLATEMPAGCEKLGSVQGSGTGGHSDEADAEGARQELREQAAELGANVVVVDKEESKHRVVRLAGSAYRCPTGK